MYRYHQATITVRIASALSSVDLHGELMRRDAAGLHLMHRGSATYHRRRGQTERQHAAASSSGLRRTRAPTPATGVQRPP